LAQGLYDDILDLQDMHNETWSVGDEPTSLLSVLQTDHAQGKMEEWDVVIVIQGLAMSKIFQKISQNIINS